jgi:hypothetical protein
MLRRVSRPRWAALRRVPGALQRGAPFPTIYPPYKGLEEGDFANHATSAAFFRKLFVPECFAGVSRKQVVSLNCRDDLG